jgi:translation initiation factor IF-2
MVLDKCRAEGIDLKNHMATLSAGLEATIREWFTEGAAATAVETSEHVDLGKAREIAKKTRRKHKEGEETQEAGAPAEGGADTTGVAVEEQPAVAAQAGTQEAAPGAPEAPATGEAAPAPADAPTSGQAVAAPHGVAEVPQAQAQPAARAPAAAAAQAAVVPTAAVVEQQQPQPVAPAAPAGTSATPVAGVGPHVQPHRQVHPAGAQPQGVDQASAQSPEAPQQAPHGQGKVRGPIKPAGPQLVPKPAKLKGPRVVRMEKPDNIRIPTGRSQSYNRPGARPSPGAGAPGAAAPGVDAGFRKKPPIVPVVIDEEEGEKKKVGAGGAKKRSPRRRGGRSAESGEGLKEWRDRDLAERSQRLAAATGGILRRHRAAAGSQKTESGEVIRGHHIVVQEPITPKNLSSVLGLKTSEIIRKLMELGTMTTTNQVLDREAAQAMALDFGIELEILRAHSAEEELVAKLQARHKGDLVTRAPVVTFLGHVDHGKTSLLDRIRSATVAAGEAGGITQHFGAYRFDKDDRHVVFLDTPGHEAFTAMRARGANMTDVVVLVVAADDGVMPQTIEAISHAKAAKVPIVVALNKIDIPGANVQKVLGQLSEHELQPREWGGSVEVIRTSATTGEGIEDLVTTLSLEAELLELKAEPAGPAFGFVIEAKMDPGLGVLARLLIRDGTLKIGDMLLAGKGYGRVRQMLDHKGKMVNESGPSTPVEVAGLDQMPEAGDRFYVVETQEQAREVAEDRIQRARTAALEPEKQITLENLFSKIESGQINELPLIVKADVQGSMEALLASINKLSGTEVRVNILHSAVGGISAGDVSLAEASNAIIIGFNVVADSSARSLAEAKKVDIRLYRIIYEVIDDIRKALEEGLAPEVKLENIGRCEIRQTFKVSKVGTIAGCYVQEGVVARNAMLRIIRDNVVVEDGRTLESLKRFKDDAREVRAGMECGLKIAGYDDIKEGDILEFYRKVEVARKL